MLATRIQLLEIMPNAAKRIDKFIVPLNAAMTEFGINTPKRVAAFLAQIAHESCELLYSQEIASGKAYDKREDLGNTCDAACSAAAKSGTTSGRFYKGHGIIQITGYENHLKASKALAIDCVNNPLLLCEPVNSCRAAAWFWKTHGLNELADKDMFTRITEIINGGHNGLDERKAYWRIAQRVIK